MSKDQDYKGEQDKPESSLNLGATVGGKITRYPQGQGKYDQAKSETQPEVKPAQRRDPARSETSPEAKPAQRDPPNETRPARPAQRDPPRSETSPKARPGRKTDPVPGEVSEKVIEGRFWKTRKPCTSWRFKTWRSRRRPRLGLLIWV